MSDVLTFVERGVLRLRLNRPKAIHALNTGMCEAMLSALVAARDDARITAVMIDHAEGRGFCAGGDIRMIAKSGEGDGADARAFFFVEYRLNHLLFTFAKPTIAFMDGVTMGGGVGISAPCAVRVATENTRFAMPETGIGLFPDVGGGWYLSRLPGRTGQYLALTGYRLDGAECVALGLATYYLGSASLADAKANIIATPDTADAILKSFSSPPPEARILAHRDEIDRFFASDVLEDILAGLEADHGEWARETLATLNGKSPQAMKISLRLLREGAAMPDFADEMRQEYAVSARTCQRHDFIEGVRAVIIEKDNTPRWHPATPAAVRDDLIDAVFAPLPVGERWSPAI